MKYHPWRPLRQIRGLCHLERYTDDCEAVRLVFSEVDFQLFFRLKFIKILASRFTVRPGIIHLQERGVRDDWSFYQVSNSDFHTWINEADGGILDAWRVTVYHFAICTVHECIDILAMEYPVCEWLPEDWNTLVDLE